MTFQELPELLTIKEAAHLINVHPNTLRNWEKEGKIAVLRVGSRRDRRFTKASIVNLVFEPVQEQSRPALGFLEKARALFN